MKLFMILYTFHKISGVFGPLPYDIDECHRRETDANQEYHDKAIAYNGKAMYIDGKKVDENSMKFVCEFHDTAPKLEYHDGVSVYP